MSGISLRVAILWRIDMSLDWQKEHYSVIVNFITYLESISDKFILKGGTALMLCYNLDRFSEDIDLDALSVNNDIIAIVDKFCVLNSMSYRVFKDTDTVKRCLIHYGGAKPLKIEVSYRRKSISSNEYSIVNNILVYCINSMALFKINAYMHRDRTRDLYDIVFICKNYIKYLDSNCITQITYALSQKGLDYFDYMIKTQKDELIDDNKLASDFLDVYSYLGCL